MLKTSGTHADWKSHIAHLDVHPLVFGINFQIHFVNLASLASRLLVKPSISSSPPLASITPLLFHSRLKTYLSTNLSHLTGTSVTPCTALKNRLDKFWKSQEVTITRPTVHHNNQCYLEELLKDLDRPVAVCVCSWIIGLDRIFTLLGLFLVRFSFKFSVWFCVVD